MIWRRVPLALVGLIFPLAANAQIMFDTTRVTCADYLAMSSTDAPLFSAFISGWFNQKTGHVTVDLNEYARNVCQRAELVCQQSRGDGLCRSPARNRHKRPIILHGELDYES